MELSSNRIILKKLTAQDVHTILVQPELFFYKHNYVSKDKWPHEGLRALLPLLHEALLKQSNEIKGPWIILSRQNELIGDIAIKQFEENTYQGKTTFYEVAFYICPKFRNNGYATESVSKLSSWFFNKLPSTKLYARCKLDNKPSNIVLSKVGFKVIESDDYIITHTLKKAELRL